MKLSWVNEYICRACKPPMGASLSSVISAAVVMPVIDCPHSMLRIGQYGGACRITQRKLARKTVAGNTRERMKRAAWLDRVSKISPPLVEEQQALRLARTPASHKD